MKVLFLSRWYPWPADNGAKIRIRNLLQSLGTRHEVTLISARSPAVPIGRPEPADEALCERVVTVPWEPSTVRGPARLLSYARPSPERVIVEPSPEMAVTIASEMEHTQFDLVVAYEMVTAVYAELFGDVPALLEDLELGGFRSALGANQPLLRRWRGRAFWWKLSRAVGRLLKPFDACTVVSESERRLLADVAPGFGPVEVIPNCLDYASYHRIREEPQRNRLVFVGSLDFEANYEAARYFLQRVFPLIQAQVPDTQLWITGRHSRTGLPPEFGAPGVTITGYVDDVRPVMAGSWVSIVPLLRGGGTRLKILEAMALGTPVVSTTKGAEGLDAEAGRHLLIADSAEGFAAAVVRLMLEPGLRSRLVCEARALVSGSHDWPRVAPRFLQLAGQIASRGGSFS